MKFIYVINKQDMNKLLDAGFKLMYSNDRMGIYVFANDPSLDFDLSTFPCIYSDQLLFNN